MSIDLSQFYEVFIEESFEGLDAMEAELLNLEPGDVDSEIINTIFRAAHSIKGGSGTFGFMAIADFTHVVETLLDQIRNGERQLEAEHVDLLLKSVDCLRGMLSAIQNEEPQESEEAIDLKKQFQAILDGEAAQADQTVESLAEHQEDSDDASNDEDVITIWEIIFAPEPHLFKTGNEPLFLFEDLEAVGDITVSANLEKLPDLAHLSPDDSFIQWTITLETEGAISEQRIAEVFEWVEDDAKIEISRKAQVEGLGLMNAQPKAEAVEEPKQETVKPIVTAKSSSEGVAKPEVKADKPAKSSVVAALSQANV